MPNNNTDFYSLPFGNYRWRLIDGYWRCIKIDGYNVENMPFTLADFLRFYGFDIPDSVIFCIAVNDKFSLNFCQSGGIIDTFIKPLNTKNKWKKCPIWK